METQNQKPGSIQKLKTPFDPEKPKNKTGYKNQKPMNLTKPKNCYHRHPMFKTQNTDMAKIAHFR